MVSQIFLFRPTIRARIVIYKTLGMKLMLTHLTDDDVVLFVDAVLTPVAEVWIDERTRPVITVILIVARVKVQITIDTMLCDNLWGRSSAKCTTCSVW